MVWALVLVTGYVLGYNPNDPFAATDEEVAYVKSHMDVNLSPDDSQMLCYGYRYREELARLVFPLLGMPLISGFNFTLTEPQCEVLLRDTIPETKYMFSVMYGGGCDHVNLALLDMFSLTRGWSEVEQWKDFTEIITGKDWSVPLTEEELTPMRYSRFCRVMNPGPCEDDLELLSRPCPVKEFTPAPEKTPAKEGPRTWKFPWEKYTFPS